MNFAVTQSDESRDELGILNQAFNEICAEMREALNKVEKSTAIQPYCDITYSIVRHGDTNAIAPFVRLAAE